MLLLNIGSDLKTKDTSSVGVSGPTMKAISNFSTRTKNLRGEILICSAPSPHQQPAEHLNSTRTFPRRGEPLFNAFIKSILPTHTPREQKKRIIKKATSRGAAAKLYAYATLPPRRISSPDNFGNN